MGSRIRSSKVRSQIHGSKLSRLPSDDYRRKLLYTQDCEKKSAPQLPDQRISAVRVLLSSHGPSSVFRTYEFRTPELQGYGKPLSPFAHIWGKFGCRFNQLPKTEQRLGEQVNNIEMVANTPAANFDASSPMRNTRFDLPLCGQTYKNFHSSKLSHQIFLINYGCPYLGRPNIYRDTANRRTLFSTSGECRF